MKKIAIIGAGGHTRSSITLLKQRYRDIIEMKIYDDNYSQRICETICDVQVSGKIKDIEETHNIFLSVGDNFLREYLYENRYSQVISDNLFHIKAYKEPSVTLGRSNQIFANTYINSYVVIGSNNIINTSAILEHEVSIGNHNHISIGAAICGKVSIGNRCLIGANAVVRDKISICDDVIIGAGSVVLKNIVMPGIYAGNPCRKIR